MKRREILGAIGGTVLLGGGTLHFLSCNSNISEIDEGYVGSHTKVTGTLSGKSQDNSRAYVGTDPMASIQMQSRWQRHLDETETGECVTLTGIVVEITDRGTIRMESGAL